MVAFNASSLVICLMLWWPRGPIGESHELTESLMQVGGDDGSSLLEGCLAMRMAHGPSTSLILPLLMSVERNWARNHLLSSGIFDILEANSLRDC